MHLPPQFAESSSWMFQTEILQALAEENAEETSGETAEETASNETMSQEKW
jgi:hypothetical protein